MITTRLTLIALLCMFATAAGAQDRWQTAYDRSNGTRTPSYDETAAYCRALASAFPEVHYTSFGTSPQGRDLPLLVVSKHRAFTPAEAARTRQAVVLIQAGIHAGEIDGKDAGFLLLRDMLVHRKHQAILDSVIILFVPIFSVDGHERSGPYNRINQNGPEEMGWRTTAQNLNLNRDYMKADAPEMRAMLRLFTSWMPDLYVDCHVTDGIDMQYDITYATELGPNIDPAIAAWLQAALLPPLLSAVEQAGHPVFWYVFPREETDLSKGMGGGASTPRFSTGYAALQNRPALLIETHMLKPYRTRVDATRAFLLGALGTVARAPSELRSLVRAADQRRAREPGIMPLAFILGDRSTPRTFKGIRFRRETGVVSGAPQVIYTGEPYELTIPFFDEILTKDSVALPAAYIIPPEWTFVPALLAVHGIRHQTTARAETVEVRSERFTEVRFGVRPYEGRQTAVCKAESVTQRRVYPPGSIVVPMRQRASHVAAHLLEPRSVDSFVAWGFFNTIFEQKEYAEEYVMEKVGKEMLDADPALRAEFAARIAADSVFARSPSARLTWMYHRSAYADQKLHVYPVGRIDDHTLRMLHVVP